MGGGGIVQITWRGEQSADEARRALSRFQTVEIHLSPGFHHALFSKLHPNAPAGAVEQMDLGGGSELLAAAAGIRSLESIVSLAGPVSRLGANVRVTSPPPRIIIEAGDQGPQAV
jgi:hypothetical protein